MSATPSHPAAVITPSLSSDQSECCFALSTAPAVPEPSSASLLTLPFARRLNPEALANVAAAHDQYRELHHPVTATRATHAPECTWMDAVLSGTPNEPVSTVSSW